jgi:hypothetical protein
MVRRVKNSRWKEITWTISINGSNNQVAQKEKFEEIIHDKTSLELAHDMSQLIKDNFNL